MGMVEDYLGGMTVHQVARLHHCRTEKVSKVLAAANVDPKIVGTTRAGLKKQGRPIAAGLKVSRIKSLPETSWAYIAGIVDGEGSLTKEANKGLNWRISVTQLAETGLCDWLAQSTGCGGVSVQHRRSTYRICEQWRVSSQKEIHGVLIKLIPYLRVKLNKAEEAVAYIEDRYPTLEE